MSRLYLTADTKYEIDCAFGIQHAYSMSGFYGFYEREKKKHINAIECAQIPHTLTFKYGKFCSFHICTENTFE